MGSSMNEFQAAKLQKEIRVACKSLEQMGYESVVIITSQDEHTEMGSEKGRHFIEHFDLVVEFLSYQEGSMPSCTSDQTNVPHPVLTKEELESFIDDALDADLPKTGSEMDGTNNGFDSDNDAKPRLTTEGFVIPKDKIVVVKQESGFNVMKKRAAKKRSSTNTSVTKNVKKTTVYKQNNGPLKNVNKADKVPESEKRTYDCVECNKKYARYETLVYHVRSKHTGERPYVCRHCGKSFVSRGGLSNHAYVHSEIHSFVCKECGQCFKRQDYLWRHQLIHSNVKKFRCEFCGLAFKDPSGFKKHKMIHTGERPYTCETCGHAFRFPKNLKEHQRVHTGEKPYTCEVCGESFRRKQKMVNHQKRKHAI